MKPAKIAGTAVCHVCHTIFPAAKLRPWLSVRPGVSALIEQAHPAWVEGCFICTADLSRFRSAYVETLLETERGEIGDLERQVIESLSNGQLVSQSMVDDPEARGSFGERSADLVAAFGGSWTFIMLFGVILVLWMGANMASVAGHPFDPYPFILLNLVLSSLAALQAPVIMMSQRRQETKDRARSRNDYLVNLKAELEIRQLHEKIDHQLANQWQKLAEMQQIQIELLQERADGRH